MACTHRPSRDSNRTKALRDEDCQNPKPSPVQACNRFDCPPMWDTRDWEQVKLCSPGGYFDLIANRTLHNACIILYLCHCSAPRAVVVEFKGDRSCANSGWQMAASWSCLTPFALPRALKTCSAVPSRSVHRNGSQPTGLR